MSYPLATDRPNLLLITTDQHRYDALGCAGHPLIRTPNIDRLARNGVRFDRAYTSNPICQPARASILTGRYPHEHGVVANLIDLRADEISYVRLLLEHGYHTASIGATQHFPPYEHYGFRYVDDVYQKIGRIDNYRRYLKRIDLDHLDAKAKGEESPFYVYTSALPAQHYCDSYIGRKATEFIENNTQHPFMLWVGFCGPHFPFDPPEPYDTMYDPSDVPLPPKVAGDLEGKPGMHFWHQNMGYEKLDDEILRKIRSHYFGNITLIDEWVGKIIDALERMGLHENTFIVFTADHGELLGDHGLLWKCEHGMYEPSVRVPFIASGAGGFAGGRTLNEFVECVDIAPTFLELAGVDVPRAMQGRSLLPAAQNHLADWRDAAFCEGRAIQTREGLDYGNPDMSVVMIRTDRWKYIYHRNDPQFCELYDLQNDPDECHNLIFQSEHSSVAAELKQRILLWRFDTQRALHGHVSADFTEILNRPFRSRAGKNDAIRAEP